MKAKGFFLHAKKKKGLRPSEVMFDKTHPYDLAERKINHLENLYKVTCTNVMIATIVRGAKEALIGIGILEA